ncbi:MAG: YncE family protein, partial [Chthoniobacterales bacterium]
APTGELNLRDDADNVRYDDESKRIYVGFGAGGIAIVSAQDGKSIGSIKLADHPEAFELEKRGHRIFVNVPNAGQVAVIDRDKGEVVATWKIGGASANFPMALDETNSRLFVGCRSPSQVLVLNTESGAVITKIDISGDPDELFYDSKRHRIYAICGGGMIDVVEQTNPNIYKAAARTVTGVGARTGIFVPERDSLFVALPRRGSQPAEIRRYELR